jgi:hypothetical protein
MLYIWFTNIYSPHPYILLRFLKALYVQNSIIFPLRNTYLFLIFSIIRSTVTLPVHIVYCTEALSQIYPSLSFSNIHIPQYWHLFWGVSVPHVVDIIIKFFSIFGITPSLGLWGTAYVVNDYENTLNNSIPNAKYVGNLKPSPSLSS